MEGDCDDMTYEEETSICNNISEERELYIRTLIHFVEPNTQLYAKKTKGYSKGQDKAVTWVQLGAALNPPLDGTEASKLFHKLREKFGKERKKVVQSMPRSGAGAGVPTYTSTWIFYKDLEFLTNHIQARQTSSNIVRRSVSPAVTPPQSSASVPSQPPQSVRNQTVTVPTLSPAWNTELSWLNSPLSTSSSSDCIEHVIVEDSTETSPSSNAVSPPPPSVLKAMAASIQPAKSVPVHDTVKKRKRDSEKLRDAIADSKQDIKDLASSLGDALKNFVKPTAPPPTPSSPPQVEAMLQPIIIAFKRVPEDDQLECVQAMLSALQQYVPKRTPNNN